MSHAISCNPSLYSNGRAICRSQRATSTRIAAAKRSQSHHLRSVGHASFARGRRVVVVGCAETSTAAADKATLVSSLEAVLEELRQLPPSEKALGNLEASTSIQDILARMKEAGYLEMFDSQPELQRGTVYPRQLAECGINNPELLAVGSVRNDAAFFGTVVLSTSLLAVLAGFLPGDWGFWGMYLSGGISLAVLAIGSTAPGLLDVLINKFSLVFPDYRERTLKHEAAHFLVAYLLGVPVTGYSLDLGKEHIDLAEAKLQRRMAGGPGLESSQVDVLAIISVAGIAAEGLNYDKVLGQNADLSTLQRVLQRSSEKLNANTQMSVTRWAVFKAAQLLKENDAAYTRLQAAMKDKKTVAQCIDAVESA